MTDVDLEYSRTEAVELVEAAFENMPSVSYYEVDEGGEIVVGTTSSGITSFGEEIIVEIPRSEDEARTTITVRARQKVRFATGGNPWRYKSEFLEELRKLRERPIDELRERGAPVGNERNDAAIDELSPAERAELESEAMIETAKVLLVLLAGLIALGALLVAVAAFLPP